MLLYVGYALAAVVGLAIVLAIVALVVQPREFRVTRRLAMGATPDALFAQVNDLHRWEDWSPWAKMDPQAQNEFSGAAAGPGACFRWSGNNLVGEGKMTILESRPGQQVKIKLEFVRPMRCTNTAEFSFVPAGGHTTVEWTMYGPFPLVNKVFGLFLNLDRMVGRDFERGLANLKELVERK